MKQIFVILFFSISRISIAQDLVVCEKIVDITAKAINSKSGSALDNYISEDFTMAGQTGNIAKMVLPRMIEQLGDSLIQFKKVSESKTDVLTLIYSFTYKSRGVKNTTFVFNVNNKLKELILFKADVKVMKDKAKVTKNMEDVISVPFKMAGDLILVEALLNGVKRNFILDNGAPRLILNSKYTAKAIDSNTISNAKGVNGNISGLNIVKIATFDFSGIKVENQELISTDLAHLEVELKAEIYGLIGYEIYKDYDLLFDYKNKTLTLLNPDKCKFYLENKFDKNKFVTVPIFMDSKGQHLAIVDVIVDDKVLKMALDCGAESNLFDESLFESLSSKVKKVKEDVLYGADHFPKKVKKGQLTALKIGTKVFKKPDTVFSSLKEISEAYKLKLDGIIGFEILSMQKTLLRYQSKELIFLD